MRARRATSYGRVGDVEAYDVALDGDARASARGKTGARGDGGMIPCSSDASRRGRVALGTGADADGASVLDAAIGSDRAVASRWTTCAETETMVRATRRGRRGEEATARTDARSVVREVACETSARDGRAVTVGVRCDDGAKLIRGWVTLDGETRLETVEDASGDDWSACSSVAVSDRMECECAVALRCGDVGVLSAAEGARAGSGRRRIVAEWARERETAHDASHYRVAYANHPRSLLHAVNVPGSSVRSRVYLVDTRARGGETRMAHEADGGESIRTISAMREFLYATSVRMYEVSGIESSFVELRDLRRARDPVARWEHLGLSAPATVRIFDSGAWRGEPSRAVGVCAFSTSESEVYLYECRRYAGEKRRHSGENICPLSYGTCVSLPCADSVRGFAMTQINSTLGELTWMDRHGEWSQSYNIGADNEASASRSIQFETPRADIPKTQARDVVAAAVMETSAVNPQSFVSMPHLYNFVVHAAVPGGMRNESSPSVDAAVRTEVMKNRAGLHAVFSDGWRMNVNELLECGEYLQSDTAASPSLVLDEWRRQIGGAAAAKKGYVKMRKAKAERNPKDAIENPFNFKNVSGRRQTRESEWNRAFHGEIIAPALEAALADYARGDESGRAIFSRRLRHAARCLETIDAKTWSEAGGKTADAAPQSSRNPPFSSSDPIVYSQGDDEKNEASFLDRLLAEWRS